MAPSSFVWTDQESEMLLNVILEYKVNKAQECIDWETCQSKYMDILKQFLEQYPAEKSNEFPHERRELTRATLTNNIKAIRGKYRLAVDTGRRSGHGRVVLLYFDLCEQIWGGSPATTMSSGIESNDSLTGSSPASSSSSFIVEPPDAASDTEQESSMPSVLKQRRDLLQERLKAHRHDRLKRKLPVETLWLNAMEEDLRVNKRLVDILEASEKQDSKNFAEMTNTLHTLTTSIAEGFSLLRQVIQSPPVQQLHYMPFEGTGHMYSHTPSQQSVHPQQAFHSFNSQTLRGTQQNQICTISTQDSSRCSTPAQSTGFSDSQALFSDDD